jgi:hypothetical protein
MGLCLTAASAGADTVDARCDTYPKGSDRASSVQACQFSQRQGYVSITRADGVRHEFSPQGSAGRYVDASGKPVLRQSGLGKRGQIYRLASESVYVYWDPAGLAGAAAMSAAASAPTALPSAPVATGPFDRRLSLQGIRFRVQATNQAELDAAAARGYQGHDQFAVLEGVLARRFPIYKTGDPNAAPSGGVRQIQYKLVAGEATWQLKVDKVVEF